MPSIKTFNAESRKYGDRILKFAPLTKDTSSELSSGNKYYARYYEFLNL